MDNMVTKNKKLLAEKQMEHLPILKLQDTPTDKQMEHLPMLKLQDPLTDKQMGHLPIFKLQDPPKSKFKQQLSTEPDVSIMCQPLVHAFTRSKHVSCLSQDDDVNCISSSSSSSSSSSCSLLSLPPSSSSSPKQFKSRSVVSNHSNLVLGAPALSRPGLPGSDSPARISSQNVSPHFQQPVSQAATTRLNSNLNDHQTESKFRSNNSRNTRFEVYNKNLGELTLKKRSCQPDFFIFPDTRTEQVSHMETLNMNTHDSDETDGMDCPMDTDEYSWSMNYESDNTSQCYDFHQNTNSNFSGMFHISSSYKDAPSKIPMGPLCNQSLEPGHRTMQGRVAAHRTMQGRVAAHSTVQGRVAGLQGHFMGGHIDRPSKRDRREVVSSVLSPSFSQCSEPGILSAETVRDGCRNICSFGRIRSDGCNVTSSSSHLNQGVVHQQTSFALSASLDTNEVLDTSEAENYYLDLDIDNQHDKFCHKLLTRNSDPNNHAQKSKDMHILCGSGVAEEAVVVRLTADTNVSFISVSDLSDSSNGSMDLEDSLCEEVSDRYKPHDFWDETDGQNKVLKQKQKVGKQGGESSSRHQVVGKGVGRSLTHQVVGESTNRYQIADEGTRKSLMQQEMCLEANSEVFHGLCYFQMKGDEMSPDDSICDCLRQTEVSLMSEQTFPQDRQKIQSVMTNTGQSDLFLRLNNSGQGSYDQHSDGTNWNPKSVHSILKQSSPAKPLHTSMNTLSPSKPLHTNMNTSSPYKPLHRNMNTPSPSKPLHTSMNISSPYKTRMDMNHLSQLRHIHQLSPSCSHQVKALLPLQYDAMHACHDSSRCSVRQNMTMKYEDKKMKPNLRSYEDEVDGLGDDEKKNFNLPRITSSKKKDENIAHCFSEEMQVNHEEMQANHEEMQANHEKMQVNSETGISYTTVVDAEVDNHHHHQVGMCWAGTCQNLLLAEAQAPQTLNAVVSCSQQQSQLFDIHNRETSRQHGEDDYMKSQDRQTPRDAQLLHHPKTVECTKTCSTQPGTSKFCSSQFDTSKVWDADINMQQSAVFHLLQELTHRRKSDTSIQDTSATSLCRSRSSPSKLGHTEDTCLEKKHMTFHRPWLNQTYTGKISEPDAGICRRLVPSPKLACNIQHGQGGQRHMGSSQDPRFKCDSKWKAQMSDKTVPYSSMLSLAASDCHSQQHPGRQTEARKFEPYTNDKWNEAPGRKEARLDTHILSAHSWLLPHHELASSSSEQNSTQKSAGHEEDIRHRYQEVQGHELQTEVNMSVRGQGQELAETSRSLRNEDEVDIHIHVLDLLQENTNLREQLEEISRSDERSCACTRIQQDILHVALDMFKNLGNEISSREHWLAELRRTNQAVRSALDLAENCRRLCRHGRRVVDVFPGSVIIRMKCRSLTSLVDLRHMHALGDLHLVLFNILCHGLEISQLNITLRVTLDMKSVMTCQDYMLRQLCQIQQTRHFIRSRREKKLVQSRKETRSVENLLNLPPTSPSPTCQCGSSLDNSCVSSAAALTYWKEMKFSSGEINRTAFQELNVCDVGCSVSSSKHSTTEELCPLFHSMNCLNSPVGLTSPKLSWSSPVTSPRKLKVCQVIAEQENVGQQDGRY